MVLSAFLNPWILDVSHPLPSSSQSWLTILAHILAHPVGWGEIIYTVKVLSTSIASKISSHQVTLLSVFLCLPFSLVNRLAFPMQAVG